MARGAAQAQRKRQAQAKPKPKRKQQTWEDQLFFSRLRRHAKLMFVLLALVFAVGFVAFGVGSGSTGISGLLQNGIFGSSSGGTSGQIKSDEKKLARNPGNTQAAVELATLYQQKHETDKALAMLERTSKVKPKNLDVLNAIARIYSDRASQAQNAAAAAQNELAARSVNPPFADANSALGSQAFGSDPLSLSLRTKATEAFTSLGTVYRKAEHAYKRVADASRGTSQEPNAQLQLASFADQTVQLLQLTGQSADADVHVAINAYKRYLQLEPKGASANQARQTLAQLRAFLPKPKH
jgi:tetratricopeptide (TPR) repeat protein